MIQQGCDSKRPLSLSLPIWCFGLAFCLTASPSHAAIDHEQAKSIFQQANVICSRDAGVLWGQTLCGPMLLVDPDDRSIVANQADAGGVLKQIDDVYVGTLPPSVTISDTTVNWSGTRWCELMWPWPMREDPDMRHVTLAHEKFHRIEADDLHIKIFDGDNRHLDTLNGRYLMELEWRALAAALQAQTPKARTTAIEDAILFRRERYRLFPKAAENEADLESNEGIAEYTGVRLGLTTPLEQKRYALRDLSSYVDAPSLVRSFAYATGPAWGLLLDQAAPNWRISFLKDQTAQRFDQRLQRALHLPDPELTRLKAREVVYDPAGSLRAHEVAREQERVAMAAQYQSSLVDGPVLTLPLNHSSYQFKPQTLVALPGGTVYPTMTLSDDWGTLKVSRGGVLMHDKPEIATVSAVNFKPQDFGGPGFELVLKPGWEVVPGLRPGDYMLQRAP